MTGVRRTAMGPAWVIVLAGILAGCGSGDADTSSDTGSDVGPPATAAETTTASSGVLDACALLSDDEVGAIIGDHDGGNPDDGIGESACAWEDAEGLKSVNLDVGRAGTADGALPDLGPTEPGPDGILFGEFDTAQFALGDRACELQVVIFGEEDVRAHEVTLIGQVRDRYGASSG